MQPEVDLGGLTRRNLDLVPQRCLRAELRRVGRFETTDDVIVDRIFREAGAIEVPEPSRVRQNNSCGDPSPDSRMVSNE